MSKPTPHNQDKSAQSHLSEPRSTSPYASKVNKVYTLVLLGEQWRVVRDSLDGNNVASIDGGDMTITIDPAYDFDTYLHHELWEYVMGEFECTYETFSGLKLFIMDHRDFDKVNRVVEAAIKTLEELP